MKGLRNVSTSLVIAMCLFVTGCVAVGKTYTSDGRQGYTLACGAQPQECYQRAGTLCGVKGYDIINNDADKAAAAYGGAFGFGGGAFVKHTMVIACKQ